jgi:hypothetical protein
MPSEKKYPTPVATYPEVRVAGALAVVAGVEGQGPGTLVEVADRGGRGGRAVCRTWAADGARNAKQANVT